jgi:hypothetical protein
MTASRPLESARRTTTRARRTATAAGTETTTILATAHRGTATRIARGRKSARRPRRRRERRIDLEHLLLGLLL